MNRSCEIELLVDDLVPPVPRGRSLRLKEYGYSQHGAYFVTLVTQGRECILGEIQNDVMFYSDAGKIAHEYWSRTPEHFPNVDIGIFEVIPNHIHGLLTINEININLEATHRAAPFRVGLPLINISCESIKPPSFSG